MPGQRGAHRPARTVSDLGKDHAGGERGWVGKESRQGRSRPGQIRAPGLGSAAAGGRDVTPPPRGAQPDPGTALRVALTRPSPRAGLFLPRGSGPCSAAFWGGQFWGSCRGRGMIWGYWPGWRVTLKGIRAPGLTGHPAEAAQCHCCGGHRTPSGVLGVAPLTAGPLCGQGGRCSWTCGWPGCRPWEPRVWGAGLRRP